MEVIETDFLHSNTAEEVPHCGEEGGQLVATLNTTPDHQWVGHKVEERANNKQVKSYQLQGIFVLYPVYLQKSKRP